MKAFVTGATGFIGGYVARKLLARGDEIVALVRTPSKATALEALGAELIQGDLNDLETLRKGMAGADSAFHIAADYRFGVWQDDCEQMRIANVTGSNNVFTIAAEEDVGRILYVSTIGYFGNTRRQIVDETFERTDFDWLTCYDETKYEAHELATHFIAQGAPIVIAQPGGVYGPDDPSDFGKLMDRIRRGWMKLTVMPSVGFNYVHVDDASDGILLAHDKGRIGESYVLGGEISTLGDLIARAARAFGQDPPKGEVPLWLIKRSVRPWRVLGPMLGFPPNLQEMIKGSEGVTYWASDEKARRELGYSPRSLDVGLRDLAAETA